MTIVILDNFNTTSIYSLLKNKLSKTYKDYITERNNFNNCYNLRKMYLKNMKCKWIENRKFIKNIHITKAPLTMIEVNVVLIYFDKNFWIVDLQHKIMTLSLNKLEILGFDEFDIIESYLLEMNFIRCLHVNKVHYLWFAYYHLIEEKKLFYDYNEKIFVTTKDNMIYDELKFISPENLDLKKYQLVVKEPTIKTFKKIIKKDYKKYLLENETIEKLVSLFDAPYKKIPKIDYPKIYVTIK